MRLRTLPCEPAPRSLAHRASGLLGFCSLLVLSACSEAGSPPDESAHSKPAAQAAQKPVPSAAQPDYITQRGVFQKGTQPSNVKPGQVIVRFKSDGPQAVSECVNDTVTAQRSFQTATKDRSPSLDGVLRGLRVSGARSFFPERMGLSTDKARSRLRSRFGQIGRRPALGLSRLAPATAEALTNLYVLDLPDDADVEAAARELAKDPHVEYAQPNYLVETQYVPNDPYLGTTGAWGQTYADLWALDTIGARSAWDSARGDGIVVAVVDTGVDASHPDLAGNLWTNPGEIAGNGVDDDGNGYVDDVSGWDFFNGDADPQDGQGHGTHVSGTIAAQDDNGVGIVGVAPDAKIMALKALSDGGSGGIFGLAQAIIYAAENGADVINNSWGCSAPCPSNPIAEDAAKLAHDAGSVVVFSSGNSGADVSQYSPQNTPYVISVGATAPDDTKPTFSNHGLIDIGAPGAGLPTAPPSAQPERGMLSLRSSTCSSGMCPTDLLVGDAYVRQMGTSMAAPHAAGLAALIRQQHPEYTNEEVRQVMRRSSFDILGDGVSQDFGYGRIDAAAALAEPVPLAALITGPLGESVDEAFSVAVTGSASGTSFASYTLEYGPGVEPDTWSTISTALSPVDSGELGTWDLSEVSDGPYTLRVRALTSDGREYEDRQRVNLDRVHLTGPETGGFRSGVSIPITGTATGGGFVSYDVRILNAQTGAEVTEGNLTVENDGTERVSDGLLATWDTTGVSANHYRIILDVEVQGGTVFSEETSVIVDPTLHPGWPIDAGLLASGGGGISFTYSITDAVTLADIDGDGASEFILGYGSDVRALRHDGTDLPGWPQTIDPNGDDSLIQKSPAVGDVDGDGSVEVIAGNNAGQIFVWNADGSAQDGWPRTVGGSLTSVSIADIDADGVNDILTSTWAGAVRVFRGDGTTLPGWPRFLTNYTINYNPTVADLDGDGSPEIILSGGSPTCTIHVLDSTGNELAGWPRDTNGREAYPVAGDLDGDGDLEIVSSYANERIAAFHHDGTFVSGWPQFTNQRISGAVSLGDITGDGQLDVVVGAQSPQIGAFLGNAVLAWHANGQLVSGFPVERPGLSNSGSTVTTALADLDSDGVADIIAGGGFHEYGEGIRVYDNQGVELPGLSRPTFAAAFGRSVIPAVADMDGDGLLELAYIDRAGMAYVWDLEASAENAQPWPMYQGDPAHTGTAATPEGSDECQALLLSVAGATASSSEGSQYSATAAVDGDMSTRWSSAFSDPQWLEIDLGETRYIDRVVLHWEAAASAHYELQVSDDASSWASVFSDPSADGGTDSIDGLDIAGRFVRVYSHTRTTEWGNSLYEVEVYGDDDPTCDIIDPNDPVVVPAKIEAEDYVRFQESDPTFNGDAPCNRGDGVDAGLASEDGTCAIGWTAPDEYLEYDVRVTETGSFRIDLRVATDLADRTVNVLVDGFDLGALSVPQNGWDSYSTVSLEAYLGTGDHQLRVVFSTGEVNLNHIDVREVEEPTTDLVAPGRIEAEDYTRASEFSSENFGAVEHPQCDRGDGVDLEATTDNNGVCNVGWTEAGEFLEYDIEFPHTASWAIALRVASGVAGSSVRLEGTNGAHLGTTTLEANGWQNFEDIVISATMVQGVNTLRVVFPTGNVNINYLTVRELTSLPGRIEAEDYLTFVETDLDNHGAAESPQCDQGDGVDLQSNDDNGGQCHLGWTEPGESYSYRVTPSASQTAWNATLRAGTGLAGKTVELFVNDVSQGVFAVPALGWSSFSDVVIPVTITGYAVLRVEFPEGAVNLNYIDID